MIRALPARPIKFMRDSCLNFWQRLKIKIQFNKPPIIIGGCARSGTTLLLSILSAHPEIYAIPVETRVFCPTAYSDNFDPGAPIKLDYFYDQYLNKFPFSCNRWCEKTPRNVLCFEKILKYFKNQVKIIHIVRDGRDVVLSKHPKRPDQYWVSPEKWIRDTGIGLKYRDHSSVYTVKYEDLVLDYEKTIKDICVFLEIKCRPEILAWHRHAKVCKHDAYFGEVRDIFQDSVGKWKDSRYRERVDLLMQKPEAVELLKALGYL